MLTNEEKAEIRLFLAVPLTQKTELDTLIDNLSQTNLGEEQVIRNTLAKLRKVDSEREKASSGLIRVDVIEYKPDRACDLARYKNQLLEDLANLIGYKMDKFYPFDSQVPIRIMR